MSSETVSTIGEQKRTNYALQPMSKEKLLNFLTKDLPPAPKYFAYDAAFNCKSHPPLEEMLNSLKPLSVDEALKLKNSGAYLLDGRNSDDYAKQHVVDSVNIPLKGRYATWLARLSITINQSL